MPKQFSLSFNTYFGNLLNYKLSIMNFQNSLIFFKLESCAK